MSNWQTLKLGEIVSIKTGKIDANKAVENGKYPFFTCAREISRIDDAPYEGKVVLVAGNGDLNVKYYEGKFNAYQRTYFLTSLDENCALPKYIYFFMEHYLQILRTQSIGTTIKYIKMENLSDAIIPLPRIEEQLKIVELLEDHLSRLEAALTDVKQAKIKAAQFRRSLLQAGLNGFFNNKPRDKVSGLPETWRLKTLAYFADWTSGGTPSSKDSTLYGGDIPWIVIGDLTEDVVLETEKRITQKGLDSSSAKKLPVGTVMVAMYGASIGRTGIMGKEMTTNQAIACGIPKDEEILGQYLLYFLQSQKNEFIAAGKGGAQPNISQGVVKSWQIPLPPKDEQLQIINEIDAQLGHLAQANKVAETLLTESTGLRRSLLQAAFTGQLTKEVVSV